MSKQKIVAKQRERRANRVRNKVRGTSERPRLSVHRSSRHITAQVINDEVGVTLACASTLQSDGKGESKSTANKSAAELIGKLIAERAIKAGVSQVAFDRGRFKFHGRVAALANAAREAGLKF